MDNFYFSKESFTRKKQLLKLIGQLSPSLQKSLQKKWHEEEKLYTKKQQMRKEFFEKVDSKDREFTRRSLNLSLIPMTISQAITHQIPLRKPRRKEGSPDEPGALLWEQEEVLLTSKKDSLRKTFVVEHKGQEVKELDLSSLTFIPSKIYLQRLDCDHSKILVKMFVDHGFLKKDKTNLFLDNKEKVQSVVHLVDENEQSLAVYPLKHSSMFFEEEQVTKSLFIAQITDLQPNQKYKYRLEIYEGESLIGGTPFYTFQTMFNLEDANKGFFLPITSDLHAGREATFFRRLFKKRSLEENQGLKLIFDVLAEKEKQLTFGEDYLLSITTGDFTDNGSFTGYWADLFHCCSQVWNHVPLLGCIGNHDYYCGGYGRGHMLGGTEEDCRHWHKYITLPHNSDSQSLDGHWYSFDCGNVHLVFLDSLGKGWGKYDIDCDSVQWEWLEKDLCNWRLNTQKKKGSPEFCFVFLHSAIMSLGFWGRGFNSGNDEKVQSYLSPLFRKYGVDAVFCGHDHIYQRSFWEGTTILQNGRHGGSLRPNLGFLEKRSVYDIHSLCLDRKSRICPIIYVPPNSQMTKAEKESFNRFKTKVKEDLLTTPTASFYFFGTREITKKIGSAFDKNNQAKEKLIDDFIIQKLDDHVWLRSFAIDDNSTKKKHLDIVDMAFISKKEGQKFNLNQYQINCPEKVIK
ncbi:metallophosphoesterase [Candidatus Heimdallarchaeota archaeon]|nr:MAG: metallophosphoesterase [Candidatus Heimdallarchaeota archaeon]